MTELLEKVQHWNDSAQSEEDKVGEVRMCKINSGLFKVPWDQTKEMLERIDVSRFDVKSVKVVSPEGSE